VAGIGNLLKTLQSLTEENALLLKENEQIRQMKAEADEAKEFVKRFKKEYDQRFENMRNALELFKNKYPSKGNPAGVALANRLGRDSSRVEELEKKLRDVMEEGAKKDGQLKKYQKFYKEIKKRSTHISAAKPNPYPGLGGGMVGANPSRFAVGGQQANPSRSSTLNVQQQQQQQQQRN
jgi:regulator of replication initiation timing